MGNASELYEDREGNILNLDSIIKQDLRGNYIVDYQAGQKLMKDRWKKIRYSIGGTGANQFPDDPEGQKNQQLRVRKIIRDKDGKATYEFDWENEGELCFRKACAKDVGTGEKRRLKKDPNFLTDEGKVADEGARATYKAEIADMIAMRLKHDSFRDRVLRQTFRSLNFFIQNLRNQVMILMKMEKRSVTCRFLPMMTGKIF